MDRPNGDVTHASSFTHSIGPSSSKESVTGSLSTGEMAKQISAEDATPQVAHVNTTARPALTQEIAKPETRPLHTITTQPGDRSKPGWIKTTWVAWRIGVSKTRAKEAIATGNVKELRQEVAGIRGTEHYKGIRDAGVNKRIATETAFAVRAVQAKGFNQEADVVTYRRHDYKLPFRIDVNKNGTISVMLKAHHGVSGLGAGAFGSVTKSLRFVGDSVTLAALKTQYSSELEKMDSQQPDKKGQVIGSLFGRVEQRMFEKVQGAPYLVQVHSAGVLSSHKTRPDEGGVLVEKDKHYLEMEFCDKGEFTSGAIAKMPPSEGWGLFGNVLECLEFMHEKGVCHLDLKPQNILLKTVVEDGKERIRPRVSDLGCAESKSSRIGPRHGTQGYKAPELEEAAQKLEKAAQKIRSTVADTKEADAEIEKITKQHRLPVDPKMDSYSAGLVALDVFFPIFQNSEIGLVFLASELATHLDEPRSDLNKEVNKLPAPIQQAIRGLLERDSEKRMSITEAKGLIQQGIDELRVREAGKRK